MAPEAAPAPHPEPAPPPATPLPPSTRRALDADRILSVSAIVIGVCTLFITLYQTHLSRQAQSAQVLPYLVFGITSNDGGTHVTLRNDGVGPARIVDFRIHYRGRAQTVDPYEFFLAERPALNANRITVDKVAPGRVVPAGATIEMVGTGEADARITVLQEMLRLFALADAPRAWLAEAGALAGEKAVIAVTYASVYDDRWEARSDRLVPEAR
jgi:hypothetical protein